MPVWIQGMNTSTNINILHGSMFVCSLHFGEEKLHFLKSGRKRLKQVNACLRVVEEDNASGSAGKEEDEQPTVNEAQEPSDHNYVHDSATGPDAAANPAKTIRCRRSRGDLLMWVTEQLRSDHKLSKQVYEIFFTAGTIQYNKLITFLSPRAWKRIYVHERSLEDK
ncbi:hypothetical protein JOB18_030420 [Solea senegalensis]|uniref:THAP-type domain-containing protein n=1 Tax=Solea senegalensis TaxID=28829 RepID=A0AAV6PX63_SOLSE|nr:hypothetical protein JOB18_030420 [Solea senegalensis]